MKETLKSLKTQLFSNWDLLRILRIVIGVFLGYQGFKLHDSVAWMIAGIFIVQALTNTGCCATNCSVPSKDTKFGSVDEVSYDEIKPSQKK